MTEPWLPWPPDADRRNATALRADPDSILHLYRRLLRVRSSSAALRQGTFAWHDAPDDVLAFERAAGHDRRLVFISFSEQAVAVPVDGSWIVEVASNDDEGEGLPYGGTLGPDSAVVLRPA